MQLILLHGPGGTVRFVKLSVSAEEQERRIENPDRRAFFTLDSLETLRRLRLSEAEVEQPPIDLEIDTERQDAEASAALIAERLGRRALLQGSEQEPGHPVGAVATQHHP